MQKWFDAYLAWLRQSPEGRAEAKAQNNHGTWYDVQIAAFAHFVGKSDIAKKVLSEMPNARIAKQIEPDGRQPREMERTQAWSYSLFNLEALFDGAALASKLGIDLWSYETPDKRGIRKAWIGLCPTPRAKRNGTISRFQDCSPKNSHRSSGGPPFATASLLTSGPSTNCPRLPATSAGGCFTRKGRRLGAKKKVGNGRDRSLL